jgi:hypothetical protein
LAGRIPDVKCARDSGIRLQVKQIRANSLLGTRNKSTFNRAIDNAGLSDATVAHNDKLELP